MVCCALLLIGAFGMGCGDDDGSENGTDGGAGSGAGTGAGTGAGSGAGTGAVDAGDDDDASTDGGVRACEAPLNELPSALLPRCAGVTAQCIAECELVVESDERVDCQNTCFANDPTPGTVISCEDCRNLQLLACADANGCHDAIAALRCCVDEKCPTGSSADDCIDTMCGAEVDASLECAATETPDCVDPTKPAIVKCYDLDDLDAGF
jgi:hypothetical protein